MIIIYDHWMPVLFKLTPRRHTIGKEVTHIEIGERSSCVGSKSSQNICLKWLINLKMRQCSFTLLRHFRSASLDLEHEDIIYSVYFG